MTTRVVGEPGMGRLLDRFCPGKMIVEPVPPVTISCFYHPTIAGVKPGVLPSLWRSNAKTPQRKPQAG
jgi:hypothetical protein